MNNCAVLNRESPIRLVIAEDHALVREGLKTILAKSEYQFQICGEAISTSAAVDLVIETKPDLLLLDLSLPEKNGFEVIHSLREKGIKVKILVLTMHNSEEMVLKSIRSGADSFIVKDSSLQTLIGSIVSTLQGQTVLPPEFSHLLNASSLKDENSGEGDLLAVLSNRERDIFFDIANGLPNREIAKKLFISPRTVETHRARIIKKLNCKNTPDLIKFALTNRLINS